MMVDKPTYKVDMDEEDREERTAAAQDLSRPTLEGVLWKIWRVCCLITCFLIVFVEWVYPDLKHTPGCHFRERKKRGRKKKETM